MQLNKSDQKDPDQSFYGTIKRQSTNASASFKETLWQNKYDKLLDEHIKLKEQVESFTFGNCNQHVMEAQMTNLRTLLDQKNSEIRELQQGVEGLNHFTELVEIKDQEIEHLITQNISQKSQISEYQAQIEELLHRQHQLEEDVRDENSTHLRRVQQKYAAELRSLQEERSQLKNLLDKQYEEIRGHNEKGSRQLEMHQVECSGYLDQIEQLKFETLGLQRTINEQNQMISQLQEVHQQTIENFETKMNFLSHQSHTRQEKLLQEEIQGLKLEVDTWEKYLVSKESEYRIQIEDLQSILANKDIEYKSKMNQLNIQKSSLESDIKKLNSLIGMKQSECDNLAKQRELQVNELKKYKDLGDDLKFQLLEHERCKLTEFEELRKRLEESSKYQLDNMKSSYQTQITILQDEIKDLQQASNRSNQLRNPV